MTPLDIFFGIFYLAGFALMGLAGTLMVREFVLHFRRGCEHSLIVWAHNRNALVCVDCEARVRYTAEGYKTQEGGR